MPFKVLYRNKDVLLCKVIAGSNKLGVGVTCRREFLYFNDNFLTFAKFLKEHRTEDEPDHWQLMIELFPDDLPEIEKLIEQQAGANIKQSGTAHAEPRDEFPPFEDDDDA
jgi:hypothetical protein